MSVHGEYARSLESLLSRVRELERDENGHRWSEALASVRSDQNLDLSTAATKCMAVLDALDAALQVTSATDCRGDARYLRGPFEHLRAHCRSLLGTSE